MALSSNSIIHFTNEKEILKNILADNFKISFCKESISLSSNKPTVFYVPMVSFCDIPFSEIKYHIDSYGDYGIGLTKEWAERMGLNPVLYMNSKSLLAANIKKLLHDLIKLKIADSTALDIDQIKAALDLYRYTKNYEGVLHRKDPKKSKRKYRFSDEREWRYVPAMEQLSIFLGTEENFEKNEAEFLDAVKDLRLSFEPNDIKYIIIKDESEIHEFMSHLRDVKGANYNHKDVERLTTRILTSEQIKTDM